MTDTALSVDPGLVDARNALRDHDVSFRAMADALPQMVWSTLPDGFHDYYNLRWYEFTGVSAGSTDGEAWNGMSHPDDQERIAALGWAHEFVRPHSDESRPDGLPESLHGIIRQILAPYPALTYSKIVISGDDLKVDDRGATPLALVIHELATNAAKYGALSVSEGEVAIRTTADGGGQKQDGDALIA